MNNKLIFCCQFYVIFFNFYQLSLVFISQYNIISVVNHMPSQLTILQKAKKILSYGQELQPRKYSVKPQKKSIETSPDRMSFSSALKSQTKLKREFSFCRSKSKQNLNYSISINQSGLKQQLNRSSNFVSAYAKQTRYDKIMRLKVKPTFEQVEKNDKNKKSILNNSYNSCDSRDQGKENKVRNKASRLEKIMQIKVNKPKVNSTLIYYQPRHSSKSSTKQKRQSALKEWKECKTKIQKSNDQEEKEDRLWKVFERERQLRCKIKKEAEQREFKEQRRKQQRFQNMVSKEMTKIQKQRQIVKRKSEGFSNYIYPFY